MGKPRKGVSSKGGKVEGRGRGEDKRLEHTRLEDTSELKQMNSLSLSSHDEEVGG